MYVHQYVQHGWSPWIYALMLLAMAVFVVVGMALSMFGANRDQRGFTARHTTTDAAQSGRGGGAGPARP